MGQVQAGQQWEGGGERSSFTSALSSGSQRLSCASERVSEGPRSAVGRQQWQSGAGAAARSASSCVSERERGGSRMMGGGVGAGVAAAKQSAAVDGGSSSYCDRQSLSHLGKPARAGKPPAAGGGWAAVGRRAAGAAAKWQGWRLAPAHPTAPTCSIHLSKSMPPRRRPRRGDRSAPGSCCGRPGLLWMPRSAYCAVDGPRGRKGATRRSSSACRALLGSTAPQNFQCRADRSAQCCEPRWRASTALPPRLDRRCPRCRGHQ